MKILIIDPTLFTRGWSYTVMKGKEILHTGRIISEGDLLAEIHELAKEKEVECIIFAGAESKSYWLTKELRKITNIEVKHLGAI